jgi:hypothetical protein
VIGNQRWSTLKADSKQKASEGGGYGWKAEGRYIIILSSRKKDLGEYASFDADIPALSLCKNVGKKMIASSNAE